MGRRDPDVLRTLAIPLERGGADRALLLSDHDVVAALDLEYHAAAKCHDAETMDRVLHPYYALVLGNGQVVAREQELLHNARSAYFNFQIQDELPGSQTVRVWGDRAVVPALLRIKDQSPEGSFDPTLWFSDACVRMAGKWRYGFAQASLPLPTP